MNSAAMPTGGPPPMLVAEYAVGTNWVNREALERSLCDLDLRADT
jgi:hypothetical protein